MRQSQKTAIKKHLKENYKNKSVNIRKETAEKLEKLLYFKNITFNKLINEYINILLKQQSNFLKKQATPAETEATGKGKEATTEAKQKQE